MKDIVTHLHVSLFGQIGGFIMSINNFFRNAVHMDIQKMHVARCVAEVVLHWDTT